MARFQRQQPWYPNSGGVAHSHTSRDAAEVRWPPPAFREEVLAKQDGEAVFIDVRSPEEYRGELLAPPHLPQEQAHTSVVALRRSVLETPTCPHHWLIEAPQGPTSKGHCKKCGTEREFLNSLSDDLWRDDSDYWRRDDLGRGYGLWDGLGSARHVIDEEEMAEDA